MCFIKVKEQDISGFISMSLVSLALLENLSDLLIFVSSDLWDVGRLH